jgi:electron transport complex protein RnfB
MRLRALVCYKSIFYRTDLKALPATVIHDEPDTRVRAIWALLPQTQCKRCGFEDCQAYAQAIVHEHTPINQCPPGGEEGVRRLSKATGQALAPLNPLHGEEGVRHIAIVDEDWCIGCTLCLDACPTDAIVGTHKSMHTVIEAFCTGCELCIPVCPVDCIGLEVITPDRTGWQAWSEDEAQTALERYQKRLDRLLANTHVAPRTHTQAKRLQLSAQKRHATPLGQSNTVSGDLLGQPASEHSQPMTPTEIEQRDSLTSSPPLASALLAQALERAKRLRS